MKVSSRPDIPIRITLPSGDVKEGLAFKTTPYDIAKSISQGLADNVVVARVAYVSKLEEDAIIACDEDDGMNLMGENAFKNNNNRMHFIYAEKAQETPAGGIDSGELWDLSRPLVGDCSLSLLKFEDPEAKKVFSFASLTSCAYSFNVLSSSNRSSGTLLLISLEPL